MNRDVIKLNLKLKAKVICHKVIKKLKAQKTLVLILKYLNETQMTEHAQTGIKGHKEQEFQNIASKTIKNK